MAQTSRPCDGCGAPVSRTKPTGPIPPYCSEGCKPRCSVEGCETAAICRGWCSFHYTRWKLTGDVLTPLSRGKNEGECSLDGCSEPMRKRGWCAGHYAQWYLSGDEPQPFKWKWGQADPRPYIPRASRPPRWCSVEGCGNPHSSLGYCSKHETRYRRHGDPLAPIRSVRDEEVPCVVCGREEKDIASRFLCSKRCERLYYNHGGNVPTEYECVGCGVTVEIARGGRSGRRRRYDAKLCDSCRRSSWRSECMTVDELAERDGFLCSLCGEVVDLNLRRADSVWCPSIDHVIPRSLGGGNEPENLALAHFICNVRKGNRVA